MKPRQRAKEAQASGRTRRQFLQQTGLAGLALGALPGLVAGCEDGSTAEPADGGLADSAPADVEFMVVALPDTQYYSDHYPAVFEDQTRWIVDNAAKHKIAFVTHLGDLVDNGPNLRQWKNAKKSMSRLDQASVPYGTCVGNHDVQYSDNEYSYPTTLDSSCSNFADFDCAAKDYLDNFGPKQFAGRKWYGGASPSGQSNYQTFTVGGQLFLFLHLAVDPRAAEVKWAKQVLDANPTAAVHLSTHRYMYDYRLVDTLPFPLNGLLGGRFDTLTHSIGQKVYTKDSGTADALFQQLIKPNTNIFMVHCGHVDAELRQVSKNKAGLAVHEILVDFQEFSPKGGDGWMRLLTFNLTRKTIKVQTYSPTLKRYRKNGEGLDASLKAFQWALNSFSAYLKSFGLDPIKLQQQVDTWSKTAAGRKEFAKLLYGDGRRDSEFTLQVDFAAYPASLKGA